MKQTGTISIIKRPDWCPYRNCKILRTLQDKMCAGELPKSIKHDDDFNTHRFCLFGVLKENEIFDLQVNKSDLYIFRLLFNAIDGK